LAASSVALAASTAAADPTDHCYDVSLRPNVIYVAGSSAVKPFLGAVAAIVSKGTTPYTIVYQSQGSCTGVSAVYSTDPNARLMKDIPPMGTKPANWAVYFSADGKTSTQCLLDPAGNTVDVGVSDVFSSTCSATEPPGVQISDYQGPIQPMT